MMDKKVSRAENKLEEAIKAFRLPKDFFLGRIVLDIGSSTGGFTEFALRNGAERVIAVEKGTRQMKVPLRFDERIELHEKTDIFDFEVRERVDAVVADVSFISIREVLERVKKFEGVRNADFLIMVKPQFEASEAELNRGVVKNEKIRRRILTEFEVWARGEGFLIRAKADNETKGKKGNLERFYYLALVK